MKKKSFFVLMIITLLFGMFAACEKADSFVYVGGQELTVYDACYEFREIHEQNGYLCKTDNADYYFSGKISENKRNKFIAAQERIFDYIVSNGYTEDDLSLTIYVFKDYDGFTTSDKSIFAARVSDTKSNTQITLTLQTLYGDTTNYGLLHGLGNIIAKDMGFKTDIPNISDKTLKSFWNNSDNRILADITYPCFIQPYATKSEVKKVKRTAYNISDHIINNAGLPELINLIKTDYSEFEEPFAAYKNDWYNSIGGTAIFTAKEIPIGFTASTPTYLLTFKTSHGNYYLEKIFSDRNENAFGKDLLKSDYKTLIETLEIVETEKHEVDAKIRNESFDYGQYSVRLTSYEKTYHLGGGFYNSSSKKTVSASVMALLHEYIHHLEYGFFPENLSPGSWQGEALAIAMGSTNYFHKLYYYADYKSRELFAPTIAACEIHSGKEYSADDLFVITDISALMFGTLDLGSAGHQPGTTIARMSFTKYLQLIYGEDAFILMFTKHVGNPIPVTGKSFEQMWLEWIDWLESEYGYLRELVEFPVPDIS